MAKTGVFSFSEEKSQKLRMHRGLGFEEIIAYIESGSMVDVVDHPNRRTYPRQKIYVIDVEGYIWLVPHEYHKGDILLITAFPSRKATRTYRKEKRL